MAGIACHELNQPLQVIFGYNELLMEGIPEDRSLIANLNFIREDMESNPWQDLSEVHFRPIF